MAKIEMTKSSGGTFTPHQSGTMFKGFVEEVIVMDRVSFPDERTGGVSYFDPRQFVIRNMDGKANYTYTDDDGAEQSAPCTVRTRPLYFRCKDGGGYSAPTSKAQMYQYYTSVLGETPDWNNFDDECVLGSVVIYGVLHVSANDPQDTSKVFSNLTQTPMRNDDQTLPEGTKFIYQAERAEHNKEASSGDAPEDHATGSAGQSESYKGDCRAWVTHLVKHQVYTVEQQEKYLSWLNNSPKVEDMQRFITKAEADCASRNAPHPKDSADDLPF